MDTTTFGMPTASYPASACNITQYFEPQKLVLLITLCGVWCVVLWSFTLRFLPNGSHQGRCPLHLLKYVPGIVCTSALSPTHIISFQPLSIYDIQVADNVIGPGSTYDDAYFEISYLRTYIAAELALSQSVTTTTAAAPSGFGVTTATATTTTAASSGERRNGTLGLGWLVVVLVGGAAYLNWLV
jgi:hypothetical protein